MDAAHRQSSPKAARPGPRRVLVDNGGRKGVCTRCTWVDERDEVTAASPAPPRQLAGAPLLLPGQGKTTFLKGQRANASFPAWLGSEEGGGRGGGYLAQL